MGSVLGIPVYVDYSWLIIFVLITSTISQEYVRSHPAWQPSQHVLAGVVTSLLFFMCVFLHEMGHSLVARVFGIPVLSITLFLFGGVAQIRREPRKPAHEFLIAIAGPLTSGALSVVFFILSLITATVVNLPIVSSICFWLAGINLMLAIFNMIPGFPLDGGRVLRAIVWAVSGRFEGATRIAAGIGSFIAYFFIAMGIYLAITYKPFIHGLWIAFIGWFLLTAARSSLVQLVTRRAFAGLRVRDIMEQIPQRVSPAMSVQALVDGPILQHGLRSFVVEDGGVLRGLVTLHEIKATPRQQWENTPLQSIMVPARDLVVVDPHASLQAVTETMDERSINQMPVVDGNRVIGIMTRERLLRVLRNQLELGTR
ncbi:MAG: hypothetical protein AMJ84_06475 [Acidithiobacillales bacterium SM23_46]|nr:MAG: hypothetical protein AMJ84_06475 [Acidithiobacillales bacterium SM23_46]